MSYCDNKCLCIKGFCKACFNDITNTTHINIAGITGISTDKLNRLERDNLRFKKALELIANGNIAPSSIKGYIDEAYQKIARDALKE